MSLPNEVTNLLMSSGGYIIDRSLRFDGTAYLTRTPAAATNRDTWTWSGWIKRSGITSLQRIFAQGADDNNRTSLQFTAADLLEYTHRDASTTTDQLTSTAVFRDVSAWYHIVCAVDTTQATEANRIRLYVNGSEITAFGTANYPAQNVDTDVNSTAQLVIGANIAKSEDFSGYIAEINFIDGQQLTPSSFGETDPITGVWKPKGYTGTYGTNGFHLSFKDNTSTTTLGYDDAGSNDFILTNFSLTAGVGYDSMTDTPTNNFATFNAVNSSETITNGGLDASMSINTETVVIPPTIATPTSGKWYAEFIPTTITTTSRFSIGIVNEQRISDDSSGLGRISGTNSTGVIGQFADGYGYLADGNKTNNNTATAYGATYTTNDVIGVAFDADAGTITFYKNGVSQGVAFTGIDTTLQYYMTFAGTTGSTTSTYAAIANYGQRAFAYTPPSGYEALCVANLPDPTIKKPTLYNEAVTYTGTGATRSVTGLNFSPNLVWTKSRSATGNNSIFDSIRGINRQLIINSTLDVINRTDSLLSFDSGGFTLGSNTEVNTNGTTYVAWTWDETPTAGFDIVGWTGTGANANVPHSLGASPAMIIGKARSTVGTDQGWPVWHKSAPATNYLLLNSTAADVADATVFNSSIVANSTHFSVGTSALTNTLNDLYIYYLWSEIEGYSKFGTYTGNGSTDGPFIWCGFLPQFVIIKSLNNARDWCIKDSARNPYNVADAYLTSTATTAEAANSNEIDFLSNGFKLRNADDPSNRSGQEYVFAAFAENPFKYALAR